MYGDSGTSAQDGENQSAPGLTKVTRVHHVAQWKAEGRKFAMLTAYDYSTAKVFEQAGIPILLVGDSAANNVYGHATTLPVTVEDMIPAARGVARAAGRAFVVVDLPFGSYESGPEQALAYARERKTLPDGDFGRSRNQGLLLVGAFLDARRRGPSELARALTVVQSQSSSDLTAAEALQERGDQVAGALVVGAGMNDEG